jgi:hypothetical protein
MSIQNANVAIAVEKKNLLQLNSVVNSPNEHNYLRVVIKGLWLRVKPQYSIIKPRSVINFNCKIV